MRNLLYFINCYFKLQDSTTPQDKFDDNEIERLKDAILKHKNNLKILNFYNNNLTKIPDWINELTNLETLDLSKNKLTNITESIGNLTNLTELNLSKNNLEIIQKK